MPRRLASVALLLGCGWVGCSSGSADPDGAGSGGPTVVFESERCRIEYEVLAQQSGRFRARVAVTNGGPRSLAGWQLSWQFTNGQALTGVANGDFVQEGPQVTIPAPEWAPALEPGKTAAIAFEASYPGENGPPFDVLLDGQSCRGTGLSPTPVAGPAPTASPTPTASPSPGQEPPVAGPNPTPPPGLTPDLPRRIEAESFDRHEDSTPENEGDASCGPGPVDLEATSGGGCHVAFSTAGEWLEYDAVSPGGTFDLALRVASAEPARTGRVEVDGQSVGSFTVPSSGWQSFGVVHLRGVDLPAGPRTLRVVFETGNVNLDWLEVSPPGDGTPPPEPPTELEWREANLTTYTSYPEPGSEECINYNGCMWAGYFAGLQGQQPESWVAATNIAAIHSKDFEQYAYKTLRVRQGDLVIDAVVYDFCSDSDCSGCCTRNSSETGFLIDLESYTAARFGSTWGVVEWACLDC